MELAITFYTNTNGLPPYAYNQFVSNPEFPERLAARLENLLQLSVHLKVLLEKKESKKHETKSTPYEEDLKTNEHLQKLKEIFEVEWLSSKKLNKEKIVFSESNEETESD